MNPTRSRHRRPLAGGLLGAGLVLAGCALVTAATGPSLILGNGKPYTLQPLELVVPLATLDGWTRTAATGKGRMLARCSNDTGLCTTVVVPLREGEPATGATPTPDATRPCPPGQRPVLDENGRPACVVDLAVIVSRER